jgi:hypothetical protein
MRREDADLSFSELSNIVQPRAFLHYGAFTNILHRLRLRIVESSARMKPYASKPKAG